MGELAGFRQDGFLDDQKFKFLEGPPGLGGVRQAAQGIFSHDPERPHVSCKDGVGKLGDGEPGFAWEIEAEGFRHPCAGACGADRLVSGEMIRHGSHVTHSLHIVLAAEREQTATGLSQSPGQKSEIGQGNDARRPPDVLGHTRTIERQQRSGIGYDSGRQSQVPLLNAGDGTRFRDGEGEHKVAPGFELQTMGSSLGGRRLPVSLQDETAQNVDERDIGPRFDRQMERRKIREIRAAWIDHDQWHAVQRGLLESGAQYGVRLGGVGAKDEETSGQFNIVKTG